MIYQPQEDSYLLEKVVKRYAKGKGVLDVGSGSGMQALAARDVGAEEVLAVDVDEEAVEFCRGKGLNVVESDLFSNVSGKFDLIVFNPPYLPADSREDSESARATSGGEKGDELIVRFLQKVGSYLEEDGKILLVVSSLTPLGEIEKILRDKKMKKRVVASEKVFMEELFVWEIRTSFLTS